MAADDAFLDKAIEGLVMFALNQGEGVHLPVAGVDPLVDLRRVHGSLSWAHQSDHRRRSAGREHHDRAQASNDQLEKILSYIDIGRKEGAQVLTGGAPRKVAEYPGGYYIEPTIFKGSNDMRIFQEEIFGPVLSVTTFDSTDEALKLANDTLYGLGAGVWTRDANTAYRLGRGINVGRVWTNCYHAYPAHAAFGGYKKSGIGRETHKMMLDHYQQTKNLLVSYSPNKLGFF